jgi:hypothetical protein
VHPHYDLIIKAAEAPLLPDAFEENDSAATARDLGSGDKSHPNLTIETAGDDDWYRWQSPAGGPLTVEALFTHAANNNIDLQVYNASGNTLLGSSMSTASNEKVVLNAIAGQNYLIRVYGAGVSKDLGTGDKNYGDLTIDAVGDDDWYRWHAPATGPLTVGILFEQEEGRDVDLYLHDTSGKELGSSTNFFGNEEVKIQATAGQSYLIRVYGGSTHPDYQLVIDGPDAKFAADFNLDSRVDGNDLLILQTGAGTLTGAQHADGDADKDGDVDVADFQIWQSEYISQLAGAATSRAFASTAVPPDSGDLLAGHQLSVDADAHSGDRAQPSASQSRTQLAAAIVSTTGKRGKSFPLNSKGVSLQIDQQRNAIDRFFELLSEGRSLLKSHWH